MVTENYPHKVTGGPEEIRHNPHTTTATQEEIPYCSPTTSSGKQKKACFTSQPQFRSENTTDSIPCDNWSRPDFVGPSTIGDELQLSQFQ